MMIEIKDGVMINTDKIESLYYDESKKELVISMVSGNWFDVENTDLAFYKALVNQLNLRGNK